jgi:uncharacterized protein (DUF927 family)
MKRVVVDWRPYKDLEDNLEFREVSMGTKWIYQEIRDATTKKLCQFYINNEITPSLELQINGCYNKDKAEFCEVSFTNFDTNEYSPNVYKNGEFDWKQLSPMLDDVSLELQCLIRGGLRDFVWSIYHSIRNQAYCETGW